METTQLRVFLAIVEAESFHRAAAALGMSQSTVSFHLRALEDELGLRLLERSRRGVFLTEAGQHVRRHALRETAARSDLRALLHGQPGGLAGVVTIAASSIPGDFMLPPVLAALRTLHPGVNVVLEVSDSRRALGALLQGSCDFALVGIRTPERSLVFSVFAEDEILLVATPALAAQAVREGPGGLAPWVLREEGSGTQASVKKLLARVPVGAARTTVNSTEAARRCALAGLGLTFISRLAIGDDLRTGRLRQVPWPGLPQRRRFYLARPRARPFEPAAAALAKALLAAP